MSVSPQECSHQERNPRQPQMEVQLHAGKSSFSPLIVSWNKKTLVILCCNQLTLFFCFVSHITLKNSRCGGENHFARDCLAAPSMDDKTCYHCQLKGHIARSVSCLSLFPLSPCSSSTSLDWVQLTRHVDMITLENAPTRPSSL